MVFSTLYLFQFLFFYLLKESTILVIHLGMFFINIYTYYKYPSFIIYLFLKEGKFRKSKNNIFKKSSIPEEILSQKFDEIIDKLSQVKYSKDFSSNLLLKKDELLIFDIPNFIKKKEVLNLSGTHGFSIRLMKGVSYRFGQFEGGLKRTLLNLIWVT